MTTSVFEPEEVDEGPDENQIELEKEIKFYTNYNLEVSHMMKEYISKLKKEIVKI